MYSERFKIYKEEVVAAFLKKSEQANESWLVDLNRRKIREHCIERIESGVEPNDRRALSDFLKMKADDHDYLTAINATDADYFQGLLQFLKKPSRNPASTTVELLSWLIHFPARPYSTYLEYGGNQPITVEEELILYNEQKDQRDISDSDVEQPEIPAPQIVIGEAERDPPVQPVSKDTGPNGTGSKIIGKPWLIGVSVILIGVLIWRFTAKDNECMYWNDDHYVATSCSVPRLDTPLIKFDEKKLRGFRRIKKVDTLTAYSVNKLWWVRVGDSIELYTAGGKHPLYGDKKLKLVTDYVVNVCRNRGNRYK
jgi:hypothetical protein